MKEKVNNLIIFSFLIVSKNTNPEVEFTKFNFIQLSLQCHQLVGLEWKTI